MASQKDKDAWAEMEDEYDRLREAVGIDKFDLDTQLSQQAALYLDASDLYVAATDKRDYFKDRVTRQLADSAADLRVTGDYKSETAIKEAAEATPEMRFAKERLAFWVSKANRTFALREAIDQRGKMLKELAHLYVSGYYQTTGAGATGRRLENHQYEANRERLKRARLSRPDET